jgi:hypothetical protein
VTSQKDFNGLKLRIRRLIRREEMRRIGVTSLKEVNWCSLEGDEAAFVPFRDNGETVYLSTEVRGYCNYILLMRHELFHIKHLRLAELVEKLPVPRVIRLILRKLLVEFPADRYEHSGSPIVKAFCEKCPNKPN